MIILEKNFDIMLEHRILLLESFEGIPVIWQHNDGILIDL